MCKVVQELSQYIIICDRAWENRSYLHKIHFFILWHVCLNQARAGLWLARAWFLKIDPVWIVCMCMCVFASVCVYPPPRLLITSGVMWHDIDPIQLVKQVL